MAVSPDILLHVAGCVFGLHSLVLHVRWPWLLRQLQQLQDFSDEESDINFQLKLYQESISEPQGKRCPLQTVTLLKPLLYTQCIADEHLRSNAEEEEERKTLPGNKRGRSPEKGVSSRLLTKKRARRLFQESVETIEEVVRVELFGAEVIEVVPLIEYVYTFKVRLLHASSARQTLQLAQWMGLGDRLRYCCLKVAVRQVTMKNWMELLLAASTLSDASMRRVLSDRLVSFLHELQPVQYQDAMKQIPAASLEWIEDQDTLVRAIVGLINSIRLAAFWRNVLDALVKWIKHRFDGNRGEMPSLRKMHCHATLDWEPYVELSRIECFTNTASSNSTPLHVTLFEFGHFVLQACINAADPTPMLWRVIRRESPKFFSEEAEVLEDAELNKGPEFWIRGQLVIKYQPSNRGGAVVVEETRIDYRHCFGQYCRWRALVSPSKLPESTRTTTTQEEGWVQYEDPASNYYRRTLCTVSGKLFLWGDPICSLYHHLLQTTLFYCEPNNATPEVAEVLSVSMMLRMPLDTLSLVLCSDRLRVPDGERTVLRCLNRFVFGRDLYERSPSGSQPRNYIGRAEDASRLYRCVRWCFVPLDDIMETLRWSPRELKLYEIIVESLNDPNRSRQRRRPWGWRKYWDAYMVNETNLSEFEIEAGDSNLSPRSAARRELS